MILHCLHIVMANAHLLPKNEVLLVHKLASFCVTVQTVCPNGYVYLQSLIYSEVHLLFESTAYQECAV